MPVREVNGRQVWSASWARLFVVVSILDYKRNVNPFILMKRHRAVSLPLLIVILITTSLHTLWDGAVSAGVMTLCTQHYVAAKRLECCQATANGHVLLTTQHNAARNIKCHSGLELLLISYGVGPIV